MPVPRARAAKLAITVTVKAIDTHRWICRTHLFQFNVPSFDSRLLSRWRRPVGGLDAELLAVLGVQPLPAADLHRLGTHDAAEGRSAEQMIQHIEAQMPPGGSHRDEAAVDVGR